MSALIGADGAGARQATRHKTERAAYHEGLQRFAIQQNQPPEVVDPETGEISARSDLTTVRVGTAKARAPRPGRTSATKAKRKKPGAKDVPPRNPSELGNVKGVGSERSHSRDEESALAAVIRAFTVSDGAVPQIVALDEHRTAS